MQEIALKKETSEVVKLALDKVAKRIAEMQSIIDSPSKTNGMFNFNGREGAEAGGSNDSNKIDINKVTKVSYLVSILGFIQTREREYADAANSIGLKSVPVFKWASYSVEAWENDIKVRISFLTQHEELQKLQKQREFLAQYISKDDQVMAFISEIMAQDGI